MSPASTIDGLWDFLCRHRVRLLGALAILALGGVAAAVGAYLVYPGYVDHGEPSVTLISWGLLDGAPAFRAFDDPELVGNVYGPMAYVPHALAFWLFGPTVLVGKLAAMVAAVAIPVVVYFAQRRGGGETAALGAVIAAALVLLYLPYSAWNRPDTFMALLVAAAVWAANAADPERPAWAMSVVIAVAAGAAVGMKLHAGLYFAPVAVAHAVNPRRGFPALFLMAGVGALVAMLPFAFSAFSLPTFVAWIAGHLDKGNPGPMVMKVLRYGVVFLLPAVFYLARSRGAKTPAPAAEKAGFWAYMAALALIVYPASKAGAGIHYFYPFLAVMIDQILRHARRVSDGRRATWAGVGLAVAAVVALGVPVQKRFYRALHWDEAAAVTAELGAIMARYPDRTIEMGVGDDLRLYRRTYYRTNLGFSGHPYTIDAAPLMELTMWGLPLPDATLALIRGCSTEIWLIPKGEAPFAMDGYYGGPAVPPTFADAFRASYAKSESLEFFDVWACKG